MRIHSSYWRCNIMSGPTTDEQTSSGPSRPPPSHISSRRLTLGPRGRQMSAGRARKHFAPTEVAEALRCPLNGDGSDLSVPVGTVALAPASICRPGAQEIHPGPPEGSTVSRRQTEPPKAARRPQSRRSIHLEQGFEATRLNTGTMTDLVTLAAHLLANFRTVRIPASGRQEGHADWWTMVRQGVQPTGQHTLIATDFARNWWNTAAVFSLTVWNVTCSKQSAQVRSIG